MQLSNRIDRFVTAETGREKISGGQRRASAGVLPICRDSSRMLLNLRSKKVSSHQLEWSVWGGGLEGAESPEQAAIRELGEESGYHGPIRLMRSYKFVSDEKDFQYHHFIGLVDEEFVPDINWESQTYKWIKPDEFNSLSYDLHPGFQEFIRNAYGLIEILTGVRPNV